MAIINYVLTDVAAGADLIVWSSMSGDDTGLPFSTPKYPEKTIHFYGDFGGGTVTIEGSNDPRANPQHEDHLSASWFEIEDLNGILISTSTEGGEGLAQSSLWIRPVLTGASGGNLFVSLLARKN